MPTVNRRARSFGNPLRNGMLMPGKAGRYYVLLDTPAARRQRVETT